MLQHAAFMSLPESIIFILNYLSQTHTILPVFCLQFSFIYYFAPLLYILLKGVSNVFPRFSHDFPNKSNIFPRFSMIFQDFPGFSKIFQDFPRYFQVPSALFVELPGTEHCPSARCDPSTPRRTGRSSAMRWRRWCCDAMRTLDGDIIQYISYIPYIYHIYDYICTIYIYICMQDYILCCIYIYDYVICIYIYIYDYIYICIIMYYNLSYIYIYIYIYAVMIYDIHDYI